MHFADGNNSFALANGIRTVIRVCRLTAICGRPDLSATRGQSTAWTASQQPSTHAILHQSVREPTILSGTAHCQCWKLTGDPSGHSCESTAAIWNVTETGLGDLRHWNQSDTCSTSSIRVLLRLHVFQYDRLIYQSPVWNYCIYSYPWAIIVSLVLISSIAR